MAKTSSVTIPQIIYILLIANIIVPFLGLIAVIMAYVNKDDAAEWLQSHYQYQIRTFWISLLMGLIGLLTTGIFIGFLILLFTLIWYITRCIKGLKILGVEQAHPNPTTWLLN